VTFYVGDFVQLHANTLKLAKCISALSFAAASYWRMLRALLLSFKRILPTKSEEVCIFCDSDTRTN